MPESHAHATVFQALHGMLPRSVLNVTSHLALTTYASALGQIKAEPCGRPRHSRAAKLQLRPSATSCQVALLQTPQPLSSSCCITWSTTFIHPRQSAQALRRRVSYGALLQPSAAANPAQHIKPYSQELSTVLCPAAPCTAAATATMRSASLEAAASRHSPGAQRTPGTLLFLFFLAAKCGLQVLKELLQIKYAA